LEGVSGNTRIENWRNRLLLNRIDGRVFISGTGRAGTSLLVQLLTDLGLDTGYGDVDKDLENGKDVYFPSARAGFERDLFEPTNPFIVKSPFLCDQLDQVIESGIRVGHLIIPVRNIAQAAASRRHVQKESTGKPDGPSVAGGLWDTEDGRAQEAVLAMKLARLIESAARHDIPMTFLAFPRYAIDPAYTYKQLQFLLPFMRFQHFQRIFAARVNAGIIHHFPESTPDIC